VHLQSLESDKNVKRALKIIPTRGLTMPEADCQKELAAMVEFRKLKACKYARHDDKGDWDDSN
jgi:hypothetical protein